VSELLQPHTEERLEERANPIKLITIKPLKISSLGMCIIIDILLNMLSSEFIKRNYYIHTLLYVPFNKNGHQLFY